ncbi:MULTISPECIES: signal recognition particle-docking protein FtsY [unclassified Sinorhizobium]|uniref:signal recognition particle-docking protein FtsY n=1 Tax=unclassified Sinorhizobium TaxID=2613772 RepID=UPI0035236D0D
MALSFIKKVFTFGKDKPVDEQPAQAPEALSETEANALQAELEPHSREEHLPLADDPVLPQEMDTAGGPAADATDDSPASVADQSAEASASDAEQDETEVVLPSSGQMNDIGVVPLSLLEAEAAAEEVTDEELFTDQAAVPSEPDEDVVSPTELLSEQPIARDEPPVASETADEVVPVAEPVLPKGFAARPSVPEPAAPVPQPKLSWFQRLRAGLARTSSQLTGQITALFTKRKLDDDTLQDLEDLLIQADLGVETAMRVTDTLASERYGKDVTGEDVSRIMASEIAKVLKPVAKPLQLDLSHKPHVILVVGVNGTGKTTTIGKLAAKLTSAGLKVMIAAGDTFRAAAIEQLKIWADRTKSEFVGTKLGADAAGLAFDAFQQAKTKKSDVLIIDTAGRLQNKAELMAELEKIVRVLGKLDPEAPHTVLQTLDATTGQNALNQVEIFRNVAGVNGLIMTKLDGTARGGILVAISAKHKLPVYFIGVGEGIDDLEPFEAEDFAQAIAGLGQ